MLVASQYLILQLFTGAQYLDAPRNMQWGTYIWEQPRYLLDSENRYDRVNGFAPNPISLAPAGLAHGRSVPLHSWWGPAYLGLFAVLWGITGSFTVLESVVPVAAGTTVILTYLFGTRFFSEWVGVAAALLLAFLPNFREMATIAMVEPISAVLLLGALWAMLAGRVWFAALLGSIAMLGKIDMIVLYYGMLATYTLCYQWNIRRLFVAGGIPLLVMIPWLVMIYIIFRRPTTVGGSANLDVFTTVLPIMMDQLFTLGRVLTLLGIGLLLLFAGLGAIQRARASSERTMVTSIALLGMVILLLYAAFPGASNNPRIMIPTFPMVMLLVALGLEAAGKRLRMYGLTILIMIYVLGNSAGIVYQMIEGRIDQALRPVWAALRVEAAGPILSEHYWEAALYARQQATWFEHDPAFQQNILMNEATFRQYLATTSIRYIVLPEAESEYAAMQADSLVRLYQQLPFGRDLPWQNTPLVAPGVRDYLTTMYPQRVVGRYVIYTITR
jgi:hypothetical protein